jgi:hypothetical protein
VIGGSLAQIDANFQTVVYNNLATSSNPTQVVANLKDVEVSELLMLYQLRTGSTAAIEGIVAQRAPTQYSRLESIKWTPRPVPPTPSIYYTLEEIYLDFRTAPIGAMNVTEALVETSVYAAAHLGIAYTVGDWLGQGIGFLWQKYAPESWNTFGGTIDQMLTNINDYANAVIYVGGQEARMLTMLGDNVWGVSNATGDFGDYGGLDDMGMFLYCSTQNRLCYW